MSILITSIIAGTSACLGSVIGFFLGDRRGRRIEADKNYDELIRYYESEYPEESSVM